MKWNDNETWGREVSVTSEFNIEPEQLTLQNKKNLKEWDELGVRKINGSKLPNKNIEAYLILINDNNKKRYFIVYKNFKKILKWNTSNYFAIAVGILSDSIIIN